MKGSNITSFNLTINDQCTEFKIDFSEGNKTVASLEAKRKLGTECKPKTIQACSITHGVGIQKCYYGYHSKSCQVSACETGFCPQWHPRLDYIMACAPCKTPDDSGDLCPIETPYRCFNTSCRATADQCNAAAPFASSRNSIPVETCAAHVPLRDEYGRCGSVDTFYSTTQQPSACPSSKPYHCHGKCYANRDICSTSETIHALPVSNNCISN